MVTMHRPHAVAIAAGVGLALLAACGGAGQPSPSPTASPTSTPANTSPIATPTPPPIPTATPRSTAPATQPPATAQVAIYLLRDGKVEPMHRWAHPTTPARDAAAALIAGPSPSEVAAGVATDVPPATSLLGLSIASDVATVDLSHEFAAGTDTSLARRLAQVTYTLTQFPTAHFVLFHIDGRPVSTLAGMLLVHPVSRVDFEAFTPAILVESPALGDAVRSPLRVWGTANTFEAVFRLEMVAADGRVLFAQSVTATSGTGTRGSFDVIVRFSASGSATMIVYEVSMKDGKAVNRVETPVFMPS